jgi:N-acetylglucosaminyldiphosphoundecaprenol N-acetyl-beta-D-mannosaminyltransferase
MQRYAKLLDARIMVGVGAAFDYHTGRIRDSTEWVKKAGLQWLHRLIQDPRRLWRRYLRNNPAFVWRITLQLLAQRTSPPAATSPALHATAKVKEESLKTSALA